MFSKADKGDVRTAPRDSRVPPSIISANLHVVGNLRSEGEIQIDGTVEGDVFGQAVAVGERAKVTGEIQAEEVVVCGEVVGRIRAASVQLAKTARVIGDIWHDVLAIESGARLEGHIKRLENEPKASGKLNLVASETAITDSRASDLSAPAQPKLIGKTATR